MLLDDILTVDNILKELVVLDSSFLIDLSADTPDKGKDESVHDDLITVAWEEGRTILFLLMPVTNESVKHLDHVVDDEVGSSRDGELAVPVNVLNGDVSDVVQQVVELAGELLVDELRDVGDERCDEDVVAELMRFKQDHAATRDRGRRGLCEILDFEHDRHRGLELDNGT